MSTRVRRTGRPLARLLPWAVALAALPLLAPTCGGQQPGVKAFAKGSIIIPMDACYQGNASIAPTDCVTPGGTTRDNGDVIKAYGLAYQLIKNDVPVYWVIAAGKTSLSQVDATVSYQAGSPVGVYDWVAGTAGAMPANNASGHSVDYRGGPFVIDGSDQAAVLNLFQNGNAATGTPALRTLYSGVRVHVSNVAFQGNVSQVFAGGWNAGGSVAPKLALLNIASCNSAATLNCDPKNSFSIIQGYLANANLNFAGAGGVATDTGHGAIYDALLMPDFQPTGVDWTSSNLAKYGYQVLWVPHWWAPGSCSDISGTNVSPTWIASNACRASRYPAAQIANVLKGVGGFVSAGNDLMAECAGLGSFEGVVNDQNGAIADFGAGDPASEFQVTNHLDIKLRAGTVAYTSFSSPLMQIGDFPFTAQSGAIENYQPTTTATSAFRPQVQQLVYTAAGGWSYFTFQPRGASAGSIAYLAGHDYSSGNTPTNFAGQRLVLNTLFNLSASCKPRRNPDGSAQACQQLKNLGECRPGTWQCCDAADVASGYCQVDGEPVCRPNRGPQAETCNGLDDDCNGVVDDVPASDGHVASPACYSGPAGTVDPATGKPYGICQQGTWSCQQTGTPQNPSAAWTCVGQVLPAATEACNGLDDDCNGQVDDNIPLSAVPGGSLSCFTGPPGTVMHSSFAPSICAPGTWTCQPTGTPQSPGAAWSCLGQTLPGLEQCEGALADYNCNGLIADGCDCVLGAVRSCAWPLGAGGPLPGVGICRAGTQTCVSSGGHDVWSNCVGQVLPGGWPTPAEICGNGLDDDCNGVIDDPDQCADCHAGDTRKCYPSGPAGCTPQPSGGCPSGTTASSGFCCKGVCAPGDQFCGGGKWGACLGAVSPGPVELCNGKNDRCDDNPADQGAVCAQAGFACVNGNCTRPSWSSETDCLPGYVRGGPNPGDPCVPANCLHSPAGAGTPCPAGTECQPDGTCLDRCQGLSCGEGAYCSGGSCVGGGCYATGCTGGLMCRNGTCQADVCQGVTCPEGTFCRGDYQLSPAVPDCVRLCATVACPAGQACQADASCAADPCASLICATGQACSGGSCIPDPCPPGHCGANQTCLDGRCTDDACAGITCPAGICARGQCYASNNPFGYGKPAPAAGGSGGCGCGGGDSAPTALLLALLALPVARRRSAPRARLGRGRVGSGGVLLAVALLALGGAACGKKKSAPTNCTTCGTDHCVDVKFDAAHCQACGNACAAGKACVDAVCILASPALPALSSVTPAPVAAHTTPTLTFGGDHFSAGATLRISGAGLPAAELATTFGSSTQLTAAVDLTSAQVGKLSLQVVNPDRTISNAFSIDVVTPTPAISGLSPSSAIAGSAPLVHVTGSGITSHAICVQGTGASQVAIPPQATPTATGLDCTLDLSAVAPGPLALAVRNENNVESAPATFTVTASTPVIDPGGLSPNPAGQGSVILLTVNGGGFVPQSSIQIQQGGTWASQPTQFLAATRLRAQVSLAAFAAGDYPVRVDAPGATPSDPRVASNLASPPLTVTAAPPLATGLSVTPPSPRLGDSGVQLAFSGAGFSSACTAQVLPPGLADWTAHAVNTLAGTTPSALQATTAVTGSEGTWLGRVSCSAGCGAPPCLTSAFPFVVATNVASLAAVAPAGGAQATSVDVTVTGENFVTGGGMKLRLSGLAGDIATVPDTVSPGTKARATIPLAGVDVGSHTLQAVNAGAAASNPIAFSVTPGVPSISGVTVTEACTPICDGACTPAGSCSSSPSACAVQKAAPVLVTIAGANFGTGLSTVFATPAGLPKVDVSTVPGCSVTVASASSIQVVLDTTQVLATTYTLSVENPGAAPPSGWPTAPFKVSTTSCP